MPKTKFKITSNIPELCRVKGISSRDFVKACISRDICGVDAAKKVFNGKSNIRLKTAAMISDMILQVPLSDAFSVGQHGVTPSA